MLVYNGTLDVPDLTDSDRNWLIATCLIGGFTCLALSGFCLGRRIVSPPALEAAMVIGLAAAVIANFVTGYLWPDSLWITCGHTMTLSVAAGLTLRNPLVFGSIMALLLVAWLIAVNTHVSEFSFRGDATTLVVIGVFISIGVFSILRFERQGQYDLTRQLRIQLDHDALTGVLNRTGLMTGLDGLRDIAGGTGEVWCAYVDVNFFKSINDRRGHDYGDDVLRAIAQSLIEVCEGEGLVSRWGGDEFVVMANGAPPAETSIENRVSQSLDRLKLKATVTAGVSGSGWADDPQPEEMIDRADLRMYERRDSVRTAAPGQTELPIDPDRPPPSA